MSHLNTIHRDDVDFHQKCGLPGCLSKTEYTSTNSLIKHVRTSHHALLNCTCETLHKGVDETEERVIDLFECVTHDSVF